jgi:hypothetical protein
VTCNPGRNDGIQTNVGELESDDVDWIPRVRGSVEWLQFRQGRTRTEISHKPCYLHISKLV